MRVAQFDQLAEKVLRGFASRTSRRSVFTLLGGFLAGAAGVPLLPVARAGEAEPASASDPNSGQAPPQDRGNPQDPGDPTKCDYWRYCAIDGSLCSCYGGSVNSCPPGTEMSPITWIGTCHNPADSRDYMVSYNDCCGKTSCGNCECNRNERERPVYRLSRNNDVNWCMANADSNYHCSVSVIMGLAEQ